MTEYNTFTYNLVFILINIKNVKGVHYSWHLDEQFLIIFMTKSFCSNIIRL